MTRNVTGNTELGLVNQNISFFQGNDETIKVTVENEGRIAEDISGATSIEYQIYDSSGTKVTKTLSGGGIAITDGTEGEFEVTISASDTSNMSGSFDHEAELVDGDTSTLFQGTARIRETQI